MLVKRGEKAIVPRRRPGSSAESVLAPGLRRGAEMAMSKAGYVYLLASKRNGTHYLGVTSDLPKRIYEHRIGAVPGFSRKYGCKLLVWYQAFDDLDAARHRELQMKEWQRAWKLRVIEEMNPEWVDLYDSLF